ncbi:MAG: DUF2254 domain-containing protein [Roseobacter sp.]
MSRLTWLFHFFLRTYRHLGLRVSLYALLSLLAALISPAVLLLLGPNAIFALEFDAVIPVLSILATSMLAVSTFSLNIMVSAYRAAAAATTPRAHRVLLEDTTTQSVLATFIGAFVYSLASIILFQVQFYPEDAAVIVMAVTIVVVLLVVVALLRWIQHLSTLGSVDDSIDAVAQRAQDALTNLAKSPTLGAEPILQDTILPTECDVIEAPASGYIQLIDVTGLQSTLSDGSTIYVRSRPGAHVLHGQVLAWVSGTCSATQKAQLAKSFTIGNQRTFEQDATYGLVVLSEIACKALSPGINDSGTAIAVINRATALLWRYAHTAIKEPDLVATRVFVPEVDHESMLDSVFTPIARDGADVLEVTTHLRLALTDLSTLPHSKLQDAAQKLSK